MRRREFLLTAAGSLELISSGGQRASTTQLPGATDGANPPGSTGRRQAKVGLQAKDNHWPQWLGPQRRGTVGDLSWLDLSQLQVVWEQPIGLGYSSPVSDGQWVYLQDRVGDQERVQSFSLSSGLPGWSCPNATSFHSQFPMYTDGPIPTPALQGDHLVTIGAEGRVQCLDCASGQSFWAVDGRFLGDEDPHVQSHASPPFGSGASPLIQRDRVLVSLPVQGRRCSLFQLDLESGHVVWESVPQRCSYASPALTRMHGTDVVVALHDHGLSLVAWDSGTLLMNYPFRSRVVDSENAVGPVVDSNRIFLSAYGLPGTLLEVDSHWQPRVCWESLRSVDSQYTNVISSGASLIGFSARTHRLHKVNRSSGETVQKIKLPVSRGMMVTDHRRLLILGDNAQLVMLSLEDPDDIHQIGTCDTSLKPKTFCQPCVVGKRILLRDQHRLICLAMKNLTTTGSDEISG